LGVPADYSRRAFRFKLLLITAKGFPLQSLTHAVSSEATQSASDPLRVAIAYHRTLFHLNRLPIYCEWRLLNLHRAFLYLNRLPICCECLLLNLHRAFLYLHRFPICCEWLLLNLHRAFLYFNWLPHYCFTLNKNDCIKLSTESS
jgi:hypothetical protein